MTDAQAPVDEDGARLRVRGWERHGDGTWVVPPHAALVLDERHVTTETALAFEGLDGSEPDHVTGVDVRADELIAEYGSWRRALRSINVGYVELMKSAGDPELADATGELYDAVKVEIRARGASLPWWKRLFGE